MHGAPLLALRPAADRRRHPQQLASFALKVLLFWRFLFRGFFGGSLLLCAGARERGVQTIITFLARVLKYWTYILVPRYLCGSWACPRCRILDRAWIAGRG